ncbi:MAG: hypothetical protein MI920_32420 [Kiloniellales bacterium]|nr:hypothetical protein [Kiloniellales bacterium]
MWQLRRPQTRSIIAAAVILTLGTPAFAEVINPMIDYEERMNALRSRVSSLQDSSASLTSDLEKLQDNKLQHAQQFVDLAIEMVSELIKDARPDSPLNRAIDKALYWAQSHKERVSADTTLDTADRHQLESEWQKEINEMIRARAEIEEAYDRLEAELANLSNRSRLVSEYSLINNMKLVRKQMDSFARDLNGLADYLEKLANTPDSSPTESST